MRPTLFIAAALALAALVPPSTLQSALATASACLLEAAPFVMAAELVRRLPRARGLVAYLGCGCGVGPAARSLPAAVATVALFGPWVATARLLAAIVVARLLAAAAVARALSACADGAPIRPAGARDAAACTDSASPTHALLELLPVAILSGIGAQLLPNLDAHALPPSLQLALGAATGFLLAPCALGAPALAAVLAVHAPPAAVGFLCIAGIIDLRAFSGMLTRRVPHCHQPNGGLNPTAHQTSGDACAYALLGATLLLVAVRHGDALVHPAFTLAFYGAGAVALAYAWRFRRQRNARLRWAPLLALAGALAHAPAPIYHATETTLADLFVGERIDFTGALVRNARGGALVRYAITCCRADAAPVVVRLTHTPDGRIGAWYRVSGVIVEDRDGFALDGRRVDAIAPPSDPFVYR